MYVSGYVDMMVSMHVIRLDTESVEVDEDGRIIIKNPDLFFEDWLADWQAGTGEMMGCNEEKVSLTEEDGYE